MLKITAKSMTRGEAKGIKPVIYGIGYFLPRSVYYFQPFAESNIFVKISGRKNLLSAGVWVKTILCQYL